MGVDVDEHFFDRDCGRALRADQLQYELGEGPCLDAVWEQDTFRIDDLTVEPRYGDWSRRVVAETGIRSSLSLQLFTDPEGVVISQPDRRTGLRLLYVCLTRAVTSLVVLRDTALPPELTKDAVPDA